MKGLTEKQKKILEYILQNIKEVGYPPAIREVGEHFGITPKGAYDHLKALEKKGYIRMQKNLSRSIEILKHPEYALGMVAPATSILIPLVGHIAAGRPILAEENIEGYVPFPEEYLGPGTHFALKVRGDSMIEIGILDGDTVLIQKTNEVRNGDIVVALLEDEATLKIYYKRGGKVELHPANPRYKPIITKEVIILGKLVGLYRNYL